MWLLNPDAISVSLNASMKKSHHYTKKKILKQSHIMKYSLDTQNQGKPHFFFFFFSPQTKKRFKFWYTAAVTQHCH